MPWSTKKNVIAPVDFTEASIKIVKTALSMVESPDDLHILHVIQPMDNIVPGIEVVASDEGSRADAIRNQFEEYLTTHGFPKVRSSVLIGDPASEITEYADRVDSELIVISSHGFHGIKRFLLGSVAENIVRHAHCPVLILRREDAE